MLLGLLILVGWVFAWFYFASNGHPNGKAKKKSSSAKEIKCFLSICMASRWKLISSACRKTATMKTTTEKQATHQFVPTKYYLNLTHFNYLCNQIISIIYIYIIYILIYTYILYIYNIIYKYNIYSNHNQIINENHTALKIPLMF